MNIIRNISSEFTDLRGAITKVLDDKDAAIKSILRITSKAGSIRANHYHKKDSHYTYFVSGKAEFFEKPVEGGKMESAMVNPGDMVFTPPMTMHAVRFLEDTEFYAFATEARSQEKYEEDTVRIELIK